MHASQSQGNVNKTPLDAIQRQKSLPAPAVVAPASPGRRIGRHRLLPPPASLSSKPILVRMNSDPKMLPSCEEQLGDTLDEIDLLHKIAKTPNMLLSVNSAAAAENNKADNGGGGGGVSSTGNKNKLLVKQKSLNRTLSTSVLRIKKKRSFWSSA